MTEEAAEQKVKIPHGCALKEPGPVSKFIAVLNKDAAVLGLLVAVLSLFVAIVAGIVNITTSIASLQTTVTGLQKVSDTHTTQLESLKSGQQWVIGQLNQMRLNGNPSRSPLPYPAWPSVPQAEQPIASEPKPKHSLFEPQELPKQASVKRSQLAGGLLNPDQK